MGAAILFIILISGCRQKVQDIPPDLTSERNRRKEALLRLNRYMVMRNQDLIARFVNRTGWKMNKSLTGLWYEIYVPGTGIRVTADDAVQYSYTSTLLDGTLLDSVSISSPKTVRTGRGEIERGLEEIFPLMKEGGRARVIIPPHLAYGNPGELNTDAPGSVILYDVYLIKVIK